MKMNGVHLNEVVKRTKKVTIKWLARLVLGALD